MARSAPADDLVTDVTTGDNGLYLVPALPAGPVRVSYDPAGLAAGLAPSSDLDAGTFTSATTTLALGAEVRDVDFGREGQRVAVGLGVERHRRRRHPRSRRAGHPGRDGAGGVGGADRPDHLQPHHRSRRRLVRRQPAGRQLQRDRGAEFGAQRPHAVDPDHGAGGRAPGRFGRRGERSDAAGPRWATCCGTTPTATVCTTAPSRACPACRCN